MEETTPPLQKELKRNTTETADTFLIYCWLVVVFCCNIIPFNSPRRIAKTASPGPVVSVPTLGSWKYDDL